MTVTQEALTLHKWCTQIHTEQQCDFQNIKCVSYMLYSLKHLLECDLWIAKQSKIWLECDFWNIIPSQTLDLNVTSSKRCVRIWVECDWTEQHLAWGSSWGIELSDASWYGTDLSIGIHQIIPVFMDGTKFMKCEAHIYTKSF